MNLTPLVLFLSLMSEIGGIARAQSLNQPASTATPQIRNFYGYRLEEFTYRGLAAKVAEPKQVAAGNPWVWRARFWNHEPQADTALLRRGFHIAYYDVVDLYGNREAIQHWNAFYRLMRRRGLARKVALEAFSRGGLYAYNWAASHPKQVACIYADAPVLDIRSWPGGLGIGPGSPQDWVKCRAAWHLDTDEAVQAFRGSPLDQVQAIIRGGYPLLHVCGEADEVVPISENTDLFEQRIRSAGGTITVIRKPGVKHHPHSLTDPTPIVNFILKAYHLL